MVVFFFCTWILSKLVWVLSKFKSFSIDIWWPCKINLKRVPFSSQAKIISAECFNAAKPEKERKRKYLHEQYLYSLNTKHRREKQMYVRDRVGYTYVQLNKRHAWNVSWRYSHTTAVKQYIYFFFIVRVVIVVGSVTFSQNRTIFRILYARLLFYSKSMERMFVHTLSQKWFGVRSMCMHICHMPNEKRIRCCFDFVYCILSILLVSTVELMYEFSK